MTPSAAAELHALPRVTENPPRPDLMRLQRLVVRGGAVLIALIIGLTAYALVRLHRLKLEHAEHDLTVLTQAIAEQAARALESGDLVVQSARAAIEAGAPGSADGAAVHDLLRARISGLPQVAGLFVTDARGTIVHSSRSHPARPVSLAGREHFELQRASGTDRAIVSKLLVSRFDASEAFYLSRPLRDHDGSFRGIVVVRFNPGYFQGYYHALSPGYDAHIALRHGDGALLASYSNDRAAASSQSARLTAARSLERFGLTTEVSVLRSAALEEWRQQAAVVVGMAMITVALLALLTFTILRRVRRERELAERLAASETRFRNLTELSSDWYWEQDAGYRFVYTAGSSKERCGITAEQHLGRTRWELPYTHLVHGGWESHLADLAARRQFRDLLIRRTDRDGAAHYISVSGRPFFDTDGVFEGYRGIAKEITARIEAETRLALEHAVSRVLSECETEQQALPRILEILGRTLDWDWGAYWSADDAGRFFCTTETWSTPDLEHSSFSRDTRMLQPPQELPSLLRAPWESGEPLWLTNAAADPVFVRSASAREAGLTTVFMFPVIGANRPIALMEFFSRRRRARDEALVEMARALGRQIGQFIVRARAEAREARAARELRMIAANLPNAVFRFEVASDGACRFPFMSEHLRHLCGVDAAAAMRDFREVYRLVRPAFRPALRRSIKASMTVLSDWDFEFEIRAGDRGTRWLRGQAAPQREPDGTVLWDGVLSDVTERKRAELEIIRLNLDLEKRVAERTLEFQIANAELESFAYSVSHDLRAPLRAVNSFSQILLDDYAPALDATARSHLERMRAASRRMGELIDALLGLSRVARQELRRVPVDLTALARAMIEELRQLHPERVVETAVEPALVAIGDPPLLRIVLENLIGNAWKFTAKRVPATIRVGAMTRQEKMVYYVRDNGAGFSMAYADKLFQPFQRLHDHTQFEGTGIGLATVRRIIQRHGGHVWADASVDEGAVVYFTLGTQTGDR